MAPPSPTDDRPPADLLRTAPWPVWAVLVCSLFLTLVAARYTQGDAERRMRAEFDYERAQFTVSLTDRLAAYAQILRGAAALFGAKRHVSKDDWHAYVAGLKLAKDYPAIQALDFARAVGDAQVGALVSEMHDSGVPDFAVYPPGRRDHHVITVYAEPYSGLNVRALGHDMWQSPDSRETMERARETGEPMITRKTILKIDEKIDPVAAFIMYLPVFREPGGQVYGYVFSPFRMPVLIGRLLDNKSRGISLNIYDGPPTRSHDLLYASDRPQSRRTARFVRSETLTVGGRPWTLVYASTPAFEARTNSRRVMLVLIGGFLTSLLLFSIALSLSTTRARANALALAMTHSLRESEERFRDLTEMSSDWYWEQDAQLRFTLISGGVFNKGGYRIADSMGKTRWELAIDGVSEEQWAQHRALLERREPFQNFIYRIRVAKSDFRWYTVSGRPVFDAEGSFVGYRGIGNDITERKKYEEMIRNLNETLERRVRQRTAELEASNLELESFSYSVSHDLRAPLRALNGFSLMLAEEYGDQLGESGQAYLMRIRAASERMGNLIDDMIDLARISRQELKREDVDLSTLAAEIAEGLREHAPQRRVEWRIAPGLHVSADPLLVRVLLENLLRNAWKFTSERYEAKIEVGQQPADGGDCFYVADNGAGFDMAYVDKLFKPFQRLHEPLRFEGTGVGLAIVHRIVRRHNGRIWAQSAPDHGATFYFELGKA